MLDELTNDGLRSAGAPPSARALGALLFHVGFFTLVAQSLLAREFLALYLGSEIALGVFYAAWLLWIAVGAALYLPFARRPAIAGGRLTPLLLVLPAAALVELGLLRAGRFWLGVSAAELVPFGKLALATFGATAFIGLPAGFVFAAACRATDLLPTGPSAIPISASRASGPCWPLPVWWTGPGRKQPARFLRQETCSSWPADCA